jgi:YbgC/YbaW family acyl-CoA thioester hydrolase
LLRIGVVPEPFTEHRFMAQEFELELQVRDYELDQFGVVNNAVYLRYLEHTRHEFLIRLGIDPAAVARSGRALALSEIHVVFRSPLRSRESFQVRLRVKQIRGARVRFEQTIVAAPSGRRVLEAEAVAVFLDGQGRPVRVEPEHARKFADYLIPEAAG